MSSLTFDFKDLNTRLAQQIYNMFAVILPYITQNLCLHLLHLFVTSSYNYARMHG